MLKLVLVTFLALQISAENVSSFEDCLVYSRKINDGLNDIAVSLYHDIYHPSTTAIRAVIESTDDFAQFCLGYNIHIRKYGKCVNDFIIVVPYLRKILDDFMEGDQLSVIQDFVKLQKAMSDANYVCKNRKEENFD